MFFLFFYSGNVLNDLGLLMTQLQKYDKATEYFEKALEFLNNAQRENKRIKAVLNQNLGAAYNFVGDFQRAIKHHEDGRKLFGNQIFCIMYL